jgi:hypothetical protein
LKSAALHGSGGKPSFAELPISGFMERQTPRRRAGGPYRRLVFVGQFAGDRGHVQYLLSGGQIKRCSTISASWKYDIDAG